MERKVGEIFEYNGEWYQCVECDSCGKCSLRTTECGSGTKSDIADEVFGACSKVRRTDNKHAIFKKLEKIGEPTMLDGKLVQKILTTDGYSCNGCCFKSPECDKADDDLCCKYEIYVEIKQNKEDMKQEIEYFGDENNNAKHSNSESIGKNLKEFDLEAAKAGKPVCTRDGRKARIICFDRNWEYPIVALIECENGEEMISACDKDGKARIYETQGTDLMMLPEKKEGWVNLCKNNSGDTLAVGVFPNREEAVSNCPPSYLCTIKIEWEE